MSTFFLPLLYIYLTALSDVLLFLSSGSIGLGDSGSTIFGKSIFSSTSFLFSECFLVLLAALVFLLELLEELSSILSFNRLPFHR